jgi:hypothetical protein
MTTGIVEKSSLDEATERIELGAEITRIALEYEPCRIRIEELIRGRTKLKDRRSGRSSFAAMNEKSDSNDNSNS